MVFAALTWTLMTVVAVGASGQAQPFPDDIGALHKWASNAFVLGVLLFFASVGASGWIGGRKLGWATSAIAAVIGLAAMLVLLRFVN